MVFSESMENIKKKVSEINLFDFMSFLWPGLLEIFRPVVE